MEESKQKRSVEDLHQLKEIEELERQAEEAEERSKTLRVSLSRHTHTLRHAHTCTNGQFSYLLFNSKCICVSV